jgi:hypothetical protein
VVVEVWVVEVWVVEVWGVEVWGVEVWGVEVWGVEVWGVEVWACGKPPTHCGYGKETESTNSITVASCAGEARVAFRPR